MALNEYCPECGVHAMMHATLGCSKWYPQWVSTSQCMWVRMANDTQRIEALEERVKQLEGAPKKHTITLKLSPYDLEMLQKAVDQQIQSAICAGHTYLIPSWERVLKILEK